MAPSFVLAAEIPYESDDYVASDMSTWSPSKLSAHQRAVGFFIRQQLEDSGIDQEEEEISNGLSFIDPKFPSFLTTFERSPRCAESNKILWICKPIEIHSFFMFYFE